MYFGESSPQPSRFCGPHGHPGRARLRDVDRMAAIIAGALCYTELATRFPLAGGGRGWPRSRHGFSGPVTRGTSSRLIRGAQAGGVGSDKAV
jgi:hypothetical protein